MSGINFGGVKDFYAIRTVAKRNKDLTLIDGNAKELLPLIWMRSLAGVLASIFFFYYSWQAGSERGAEYQCVLTKKDPLLPRGHIRTRGSCNHLRSGRDSVLALPVSGRTACERCFPRLGGHTWNRRQHTGDGGRQVLQRLWDASEGPNAGLRR